MIQEKSLDVGRRSARLIIAKLKEGHTYIAKNRKNRFGKRYFVYTNTNI
jgi:hypothetical protein